MTAEYDVIVIGAGVVGPAIATSLARQGRRVLIVERDWSRPDRIVGELLQPAGVKALRELGMISAISNIEAATVTGYYINFAGKSLEIDYPFKADTQPPRPVPDAVFGGNDVLRSDSTVDADAWEKDEHVRGIAFHHGDFIGNLRKIVSDEPNVTTLEATVTSILYDGDPEVAVGVRARADGLTNSYYASLVISCDGIYSKFRKDLPTMGTPSVGSYFVGLHMKNAQFPAPGRGHVILGDHAPILMYQIAPEDSRILCAYRSSKPPSQKDDALYKYMMSEVLPSVPAETRPALQLAIKSRKFRIMPNQYLPAVPQRVPGLVVIGDALNMRHPLTGGGMTVGLNDAVLLARLLHPSRVEDLADHESILCQLKKFHRQRKNLDAVINTLSVALYSLFAADRNALKILQRGCFRYFECGGSCVSGPIGLLSGMLPFPMLLFNHFFSVAFYSIYCNFGDRGLFGVPIALVEMFDVLFTAIVIFTPYLWRELVC
ncbi:squalene epoxidase Erg1p [Diutina catenulata]